LLNFVTGEPWLTLISQCGQGYDVLLLSAFGYDAYGLDSSSAALDGARGR
jgi:hypothetical protein